MPHIGFVLPHWAYWAGLLLFPCFAFLMVRRERAAGGPLGVSLPVAYLFLAAGGFLGLHRLYLRNRWWWVFVPFVLLILWGNIQSGAARNDLSEARNDRLIAEFKLETAQEKVDEGEAGAVQDVERWNAELAAIAEANADAEAAVGRWHWINRTVGVLVLLGLVADALLLPRLVRGRRNQEPGRVTPSYLMEEVEEHERPRAEPEFAGFGSGYVRWIGRINGAVGHFVAWWALIAVFAYYYEVICRYVFNSPTNWAHEGMFLMFGMQYLLAGAFALRDNAHVRVDVLYANLSPRTRATLDLVTSVFFFVFAGALAWTGYIFFSDAVEVWEVSFTEWAIQYWPVKAAIMIGAVLLILQGVARVMRDVAVLTGPPAAGAR